MERTKENILRLHVVRARPEHAESVAAELLPKDYEEWLFLRQVFGSGGATVADDLRRGIRDSTEAWYAFDALGPVGMFGVAALAGGGAAPWLRAAEGIRRHRRDVVRVGCSAISRWLSEYGVLANLASAEYPDALRCLHCLVRRVGRRGGGEKAPGAVLHTRRRGKLIMFYVIGANNTGGRDLLPEPAGALEQEKEVRHV